MALTQTGGQLARQRRRPEDDVLLATIVAGLPLPVVLITRSIRALFLLAGVIVVRVTEGLLRRRYPVFGPRLLRWQLESAGAGFAKIGQLLAHRHDVLPDRYCMEFASILDDLLSVPTPLITKRMVRALHLESLEQRFAEFEVMPLSAASIAQVHRARLLDGTRVVVKVMRPGIEKRFRVDLAIAGTCARLLAWHQAFRRMGIRALANELHQLTCEELDFTREVRNFRQLRQRMLDDDIDHYCPVVYPELSAPTVITMEEIVGVSVKTLMQASSAARGTPEDRRSADRPERLAAIAQLAQWAALGITPERTARLLVRSFLEQAMRHRLFHADPHAANMIVMKGGTLAWIDLGMIGWLDERLWGHEFRLREAIAEGRLDAAYRHLLATVEPLPAGDLSQFEAEFKRILRDWLAEVEQPSEEPGRAGVARRSNFHLFSQTLGAVRRAGLRLPAPLVRLYRTIIIGDMVVLQLDPSVNWQSLIRDFVADERLRQTVDLCERGPSLVNARAAIELAVEGPGLLVDAVKRMQEPASSANARTRSISRSERAVRRLIGQVKLAVTATTLVLFVAPRLPVDWLPGLLTPGIEAVRPYAWWTLGVGLVAIWMLSQVQEEFED
ncbi:MAG: AarF/ABC1/UbiB kinase family protein [Gemmatimonadaceae bacterium]|nr:AarF/ABC1/UbiB kinase family protein [Gemmatimonadaceae bacterium]